MILKYDYFVMSSDGITLNNKKTPIIHDKITHFSQNCVTMKELMDKFHEKQS